MQLLPLCWLLLAGLAASDGALLHSAVVDPDGDVIVRWTPEEDTNSIVFQVEARTRGWAAIGFSPTGGMTGADIVMAWVTDGQTHIQDMHAVSNGAPLLDDSDDVQLLEGIENDTHTVFTFRRPLRSCDSRHDMDLGMDTTRLIWALHASDPTPGRGPSYHGTRRGVRSVSLDGSGVFQFPDDGQTESFVIGNTETEILAENTYYHCAIHKLPDFVQKVHYTGFRVKLSPASAPYVHHIVLYECSVPTSMEDYFEDYAKNHPGAICHSPNMPPSWSSCQTGVLVWVGSSEGDMLPNNVGMPLGDDHGGATYFMLERHYNNPHSHSGILDSSGLEIFYTRSLRPVEAGMFVAGHMVYSTLLIPPGQRRFTTGSVCAHHCTQEHLPADGVQVHSVLLHAHQAGRSISVRHIRAGRELPPLITDKYFDFNYQQSRRMDPTLRILPGDTLLVECGYNTEDRTNVTMGGFNAKNEMCLAFITYFPRMALQYCSSSPHIGDYLQTMGVHTVDVGGLVLPSVSGGDVWTISGFRHDTPKFSDILDSMPKEIAKKKTNATAGHLGDWFNRAQLSTISVSVDGETPKTTLYEYLTTMSWSQPVIESLQRQANGGRLFHQCRPGDPQQLDDYRNIFSGPHPFPEFEPWASERIPGCAKALSGTTSRRSQLGGATVVLAFTVLGLLL